MLFRLRILCRNRSERQAWYERRLTQQKDSLDVLVIGSPVFPQFATDTGGSFVILDTRKNIEKFVAHHQLQRKEYKSVLRDVAHRWKMGKIELNDVISTALFALDIDPGANDYSIREAYQLKIRMYAERNSPEDEGLLNEAIWQATWARDFLLENGTALD